MSSRGLVRWSGIVLLSALAGLASTARATPCEMPGCGYQMCSAGVVPVTPVAGDPFTPLDVGSLPPSRDISRWRQNMSFHDGRNPFFIDVDVEGDHVYVAENGGLQLWRHTGDASFPRVGRAFLGTTEGARWCGTPELKHPIQWVDVPDGDGDVAVIGAGMCDLGMLVFDTTVRSSPQLRYQADGFDLGGLWTTRVGGAGYAVAGTRGAGLLVYDLDAALARTSACRDDTVDATTCGVPRRRLGTVAQIAGVHGVGRHVVASGARIEVFDLTSPSDEPIVSWDPGIAGFNLGVAMVAWGGTTLVAAVHLVEGRLAELGLWDVGECLSSSCDAPIALDAVTLDASNLPSFLTASSRAGVPHLYVGTEFSCVRDEGDWLYRIVDPGRAAHLERVEVRREYFGWYYPASSVDGAFDARPRRARFLGDHLYRAVWTFLDAHRWVGSDVATCGDAICDPVAEACSSCAFDCGPCAADDGGLASDAGAVDAASPLLDGGSGPDAGAGPGTPTSDGCGCRVAAPRRGMLPLAGLAVALALWRLRRR